MNKTFCLDEETKSAIDRVMRSMKSEQSTVEGMLKQAKKDLPHQEIITSLKGDKKTENSIGRCQKQQPCFKGSVAKDTTSPLLKSGKTLVFISHSMPKESLKKLAHDAKTHNARLVIRGMVDGSMLKTAELAKEIGHPVDIDPKLFEQFKIEKVPVFVVSSKQGYKKLSGNVELSWAQEQLEAKS